MSATIRMESLYGQALDLLNPRIDQVDFEEIAHSLARITRFTGATEKPVSVAQHTLICADIAPFALKPLVLLHDAHEQRTTDLGTPQAKTHAAIAGEMYGPTAPDIVAGAWAEFKHRHDVVIHKAAGIPLPDAEQKAAIKRIDLLAMRVEVRDFNGDQMARGAWPEEVRRLVPPPKRYRLRSIEDNAAELHALFRTMLPIFARPDIVRAANAR